MLDTFSGAGTSLISLLENAVEHGVCYARFDWYDRDDETRMGRTDLVFDMSLGVYLSKPNRTQTVRVYVFDGREPQRKFHAYLWKPDETKEPTRWVYPDRDEQNPYHQYLWPVLLAQTKPEKVTTIAWQALKRAKKAKHFGLPQLPEGAHLAFFRWTLVRMSHTDPHFHFEPSNQDIPFDLDHSAKVVHLSIYDTQPTWGELWGREATLAG